MHSSVSRLGDTSFSLTYKLQFLQQVLHLHLHSLNGTVVSLMAPLYQGEPGKHGDKSAGRIGTFELGEWHWICSSWLSGTLIEIGIHTDEMM